MAHAQKILPHYTYEDWLRWEGRWELIDGFPIAMSPSPVPNHQRTVAALITELSVALKKSKCTQCVVYDFIDYKIADDTIFEPDVLIVCGDIHKPYLDFPPTVIVEVLSPSTALRDRHTKYELYEQQGVKYYLIADADKRLIEIYELVNGKYVLKSYNKFFILNLNKECSIRFNSIAVWE